MKYNPILKSKGDFKYVDAKKVKAFIQKLGYELLPVQGSYDKYWMTGQTVDGKYYDFISGPKYYQLVINRFDFGISASGDLNGWQMAGEIRREIKGSAK